MTSVLSQLSIFYSSASNQFGSLKGSLAHMLDSTSNYSNHLKDQAEGRKISWGSRTVLEIKKGLDRAVQVGSIPCKLAGFSRHFGNQLVPFIELLLKCPGKIKRPVDASLSGFVNLCDLWELFNTSAYFANSFSKDRKDGNYASIAGQALLVPTNISNAILFCRDTGLAQFAFLGKMGAAIGGIHVFGFAPHIANVLKSIPLIRALPGISAPGFTGEWIGNTLPLKFVSKIEALPLCFATLCLAYVCFAKEEWNNIQKTKADIKTTETKIKNHEDEGKSSGARTSSAKPDEDSIVLVEQDEDDEDKEQDLIVVNKNNAFTSLPMARAFHEQLSNVLTNEEFESATEDQKTDHSARVNALRKLVADEMATGKRDVYKNLLDKKNHQEHDLSMAKWKLVTCIAKFALYTTILGAMFDIRACASIARNAPAMAAFGTVTMLLGGMTCYKGFIYEKPLSQIFSH